MDSQKRNSQAVVVAVVVLVLVLIGGGVAWWIMAKPKEVLTPSAPVVTDKPAEQIILATRNVDAPESGSDSGDREFEYKLMSVDAKTLAEKQLGSLKNSIFVNPFTLMDDGIYFINPEGELGHYNFTTKQTQVVKIPGVEPVFGFFDVNSMWDFELSVSGTTLVYLRGTCAEGTRCDLYMYDMSSKANTLILANLQKLMKMNETSGLALHAYDPGKNIVTVKKGGSDGMSSYTELFEVSLTEKKVMTSQKIENVGDKEGDPLTEKEKQDNAKSDELYRTRLTCGSASAVQEYTTFKLDNGDYATEQQTTITSGVLKKSYHPTYIVGCHRP